jgi:hypothetical protein
VTDDDVEDYLKITQECYSFLIGDKLLVEVKAKVRCKLNEPDPAEEE